jgi:uncharacterized protein YqeY
MSLKEKIQEDLTIALKDGKNLELSVLRMLSAAISNKETEKRTKIWKTKPDLSQEELKKESRLSDEEIFDVIYSEIKKRKESIELFEKGGRKELADKENKELNVLKSYLPEQISEDEVKELIRAAVLKIGAKGMKDMGKLMSEISPPLKGKADMGLVSKIAKDLLSQN